MSNIISNPGLYGVLVGACLTFIFSQIVSSQKRVVERENLIDLFIDEIEVNWWKLDHLKMAAAKVKSDAGRSRSGFLDVYEFEGEVINFHGEPEFKIEVYNLKLFETEGLKLLKYLSKKERRKFWKVYSKLRDVEQIRQIINDLQSKDEDLSSYKKTFVVLVTEAFEELQEFSGQLQSKRPKWRQIWKELLG